MRKGLLVFFIGLFGALFAALPVTAQSWSPDAGDTAVIRGLGDSFPNSEDLSLSSDYSVYRFSKDGVTYLQINRVDGEVLKAFAFADGADPVALPIGVLARSQFDADVDEGQVLFDGSRVQGEGHRCPCGSEVVYQGPGGTIVVVTDRDGNVIQVIVLGGNQTK